MSGESFPGERAARHRGKHMKMEKLLLLRERRPASRRQIIDPTTPPHPHPSPGGKVSAPRTCV